MIRSSPIQLPVWERTCLRSFWQLRTQIRQIAETVPGEMTHPGDFDEYHVNEEEFTKLLIEMFYKN